MQSHPSVRAACAISLNKQLDGEMSLSSPDKVYGEETGATPLQRCALKKPIFVSRKDVQAAAGALTVGALGGLVAGLIQLGMPEEIATRLGEHVHKGDTLVIVHAMNEEAAARARSILAAHNPRPEAGQTPSGVVSVAAQA